MKSALIMLSLFYLAVAYDNDYDKDLDESCTSGKAFSRIESVHSNVNEDRKFELTCKEDADITNDCSWSKDWVNEWDGKMDFQCPVGHVIAGAKSEHNNHHEDRKWKWRCCRLDNCISFKVTTQCGYNGYDKEIDCEIEDGKWFVGVRSFHHDSYEDRKYRWYAVECLE